MRSLPDPKEVFIAKHEERRAAYAEAQGDRGRVQNPGANDVKADPKPISALAERILIWMATQQRLRGDTAVLAAAAVGCSDSQAQAAIDEIVTVGFIEPCRIFDA